MLNLVIILGEVLNTFQRKIHFIRDSNHILTDFEGVCFNKTNSLSFKAEFTRLYVVSKKKKLFQWAVNEL